MSVTLPSAALFDDMTAAPVSDTGIVRVEVIRPTPEMRSNPLFDIPRHSRFVLLGTHQDDRVTVLAAEAYLDGNIVTLGPAVALRENAEWVAPDATCDYCGMPIDVGARYCFDRPCRVMNNRRETTWRVA